MTAPQKISSKYKRCRRQFFLSATLGYGLYYVCRLSLNVVKKPIVDAGVLTESELGIIGSALFITYAVGKLANGFLADRSDIRKFLSVGLLGTALINLCLGFTTSFSVFLVLWGLNGWMQSMGAAPCVVGLSRWFSDKERGTYYGLWSSSHNIGEALTFVGTSAIVAALGWQWGFRSAALLGILGAVLIVLFMKDAPQSCGLPPIAEYKNENVDARQKESEMSVGQMQKMVIKNPVIWILTLSSACMYISRYAVHSWGIFFLEAEKGYSNIEASAIISISSVCGIIGTITSGYISDRFFSGKRYLPAILFGLVNVTGLMMFLFGPKSLDALSMVLLGLATGALICFLGGLMAVDVAPKGASGAALGIIGVASYFAAGLQDFISGFIIQGSRAAGASIYDFSSISCFWSGSAVLSVIFCTIAWWFVKKRLLPLSSANSNACLDK